MYILCKSVNVVMEIQFDGRYSNSVTEPRN
jgi:hypothetical protein